MLKGKNVLENVMTSTSQHHNNDNWLVWANEHYVHYAPISCQW